MANAVRSSVLPRNPSAAPPVHAPGVGSAASAYPLPLEAVSATVNPATSIHREAVSPRVMRGSLSWARLGTPTKFSAGSTSRPSSSACHHDRGGGDRLSESWTSLAWADGRCANELSANGDVQVG